MLLPIVRRGEGMCVESGSEGGLVAEALQRLAMRSEAESERYTTLRSIRQHTSAYVSIRQHRQHTSAYVSTRQYTSAHVSTRQHTSAYISQDKRQAMRPEVSVSICTFVPVNASSKLCTTRPPQQARQSETDNTNTQYPEYQNKQAVN